MLDPFAFDEALQLTTTEESYPGRAHFKIDDNEVDLEVDRPRGFERIQALFGTYTPTLRVRRSVLGFGLELLSDEEREDRRKWIMDNEAHKFHAVTVDGDKYVPPRLPTPSEQMAQAGKLLAGPRRHNPELIKAIKKLPKTQQIVIKLPRGKALTHQQKTQLESVVKGIVTGSFSATKKRVSA